ncbi:hypothetical protein HOLleu_13409 [Holothuria leucospilota]|uniref:Alpha-2-macroglobulin bait region domain-containing protein n=1 Tax=Holothuria leucospilota TaxID=206669 RepID=A0A9Q1HDW3_HOLLE|nr:hypothetical protein HOLleu_13409 [Holothuria leucospilota]
MNIQCRIFLMVMSFAVALQSSLGSKEEYPSTYLILAPATIRPGLTFTLSVQIREASGPVNVTAAIKNGESDNAVPQLRAEGIFSPGQVSTLEMQVPDTLPAPAGQYKLEITGLGGGLNFNETKYLQFDVTHFAIFVQTDKAIYKPGQTVNYRIFAVYPGMQVYKGPFDVTVADPDGNIIQLYTGLQNVTYGVITQSMVMSSEPVLGDWEIKVSAEGQTKTQTVTIDEYVLPKFEVTVVLPPYITEEDSALNIQISSKYTYGKPVEGSADVIIKFNYYDNSITRSVQLDDTADVAVSKDDLLTLYKSINTWNDKMYEGLVIIVTAVVTEGLTGLKQNSSATVTYYDKPIKIEALPITSQVFKPGLTYTAFLAVTHQDGSMLTYHERREGLVIAFGVSKNNGNKEWQRGGYSIPETGVVVARYDVPHNTSSLEINAYYYDKPSTQELGTYIGGSYSKYLTQMQSPSSSFMQIALETEKVSVGEDVRMIVTTTEVASELNYVVVSQGDIKLSTSVTTSKTRTPITFTIDSSMTPKANVIISFVRADGEVVVDSVELNVDGSFQNQVSVSFDKTTTEPGDDITFSVESSPDSLVGILAVDQSVLLLKSGNDITQEQQESIAAAAVALLRQHHHHHHHL